MQQGFPQEVLKALSESGLVPKEILDLFSGQASEDLMDGPFGLFKILSGKDNGIFGGTPIEVMMSMSCNCPVCSGQAFELKDGVVVSSDKIEMKVINTDGLGPVIRHTIDLAGKMLVGVNSDKILTYRQMLELANDEIVGLNCQISAGTAGKIYLDHSMMVFDGKPAVMHTIDDNKLELQLPLGEVKSLGDLLNEAAIYIQDELHRLDLEEAWAMNEAFDQDNAGKAEAEPEGEPKAAWSQPFRVCGSSAMGAAESEL